MSDLHEYICYWLQNNTLLLEKSIGYKIEENTLTKCLGGLKAKEAISEKVIFINIQTDALTPEHFGEMILRSSLYGASISVLASPQIPAILAWPAKWLDDISNKDTKFHLLSLGFINYDYRKQAKKGIFNNFFRCLFKQKKTAKVYRVE